MKNLFENSGAAFSLILFALGVADICLALSRCYEIFWLVFVLLLFYFVAGFLAVALDEYENEDININNKW